MPPEPETRRAQQLALFFMAGLTGAATYKNRRQVEEFAPQEAWPARFEDFFANFNADFKQKVKVAREQEPDARMVGTLTPELWRINNDAVLFTELMSPVDEQRNASFLTSVRTFVELVQAYDDRYKPDGMSVRGCVWTAGFPLRNKAVRIVQSDIAILTMDGQEADDVASPTVSPTNFIGRDMDLGYAIAEACPPGRIVATLDAVHFLMSVQPAEVTDVGVWFTGWQWLPEIFGGVNYPRLFVELGERPRKRDPWDQVPGVADDTVHALVRGQADKLNPPAFEELFTSMRQVYPQLIVAYSSAKDRPYVHTARYEDRDPASLDAIGEDREFVAPPTSVEAISLDELNQILLVLQERPEVIADLRQCLIDIADHRTYQIWKDELQYDEQLYRLDEELAFRNDTQRRLLETLTLVKNDVLRVRLNKCDGSRIFMTDGFWIPASIRVFPDADESDLVIRTCRDIGAMEWATGVIDVATGCGHTLLRYEGDAIRLGFDRGTRAVAYAAINALVNGTQNATVAVNDIRHGLPALLGNSAAERLLITVNMPFALVPKPDTLARSSDGGRLGYEPTEWALDAIHGLARRLPSACEVRCVVLAYSIGSQGDDRWIVKDLAIEKFGVHNVSWKLLPEQRLWRVNGKKEEANPMPVERLSRKANCRFHVRVEKDRERVRADYEELIVQLKKQECHHLGYGVLDLRLRGGSSHTLRVA